MQDVFIEYMVKRKSTPQMLLAKCGIFLAALLLAVLALLFSGALGTFSILGAAAAVGAVYGAYFLITSMNVEFEYSVTNGEIDVDKIISQRKRRRLVTVNCREAEAFGRYTPAEHQNKSYNTKILACADPASGDCWYITARIKDKGLVLVVLNANDRMLESIKTFLPRSVLQEAVRAGAL